MPLFLKHKDTHFGVGDRVRISQKIEEEGKIRGAIFDGIVIAVKKGPNPSFVVRRIGEGRVGIERIFPLSLPTIDKITVVKKGTAGVKHGKLYFLRKKNPREIDKIFRRAQKRSGSSKKN